MPEYLPRLQLNFTILKMLKFIGKSYCTRNVKEIVPVSC